MGYFAIAMNDTPTGLISAIKANLELYKLVNKNNNYNYLLDMMQGDLEKLENSYPNIESPFPYLNEEEIQVLAEELQKNVDSDIENLKLCYSIAELSDPKIFQESLDTLNNLDVNMYTGEVTLKNKGE